MRAWTLPAVIYYLLFGLACSERAVSSANGSGGSSYGSSGSSAGTSVGGTIATHSSDTVAVSSGGAAATDSGGTAATSVSGMGGDGLRRGPFKMLVMNTCLEYTHDSIPSGQALLTALGQKTDTQLPVGAAPGSQFTITIANDDLSDFTEANLRNYEILFWLSPTGTVFSSGGANGVVGMAAVQKFMENGGAWVGVHSATDFEKTNQWPWYQDNLAGAWFDHHDDDGTPGSVLWDANAVAADHPAIRGVQSPWSCSDEWYFMNRDPGKVPGFVILGRLAIDQRPVSWTHELPGGGRAFYTSRGHNKTVYAEPGFMNHVHQAILWAVHRLN